MNQQELIDSMHCGLFATPTSVGQAFRQAEDFIASRTDGAYIWVLIYGILNAYHQEFNKLKEEV